MRDAFARADDLIRRVSGVREVCVFVDVGKNTTFTWTMDLLHQKKGYVDTFYDVSSNAPAAGSEEDASDDDAQDVVVEEDASDDTLDASSEDGDSEVVVDRKAECEALAQSLSADYPDFHDYYTRLRQAESRYPVFTERLIEFGWDLTAVENRLRAVHPNDEAALGLAVANEFDDLISEYHEEYAYHPAVVAFEGTGYGSQCVDYSDRFSRDPYPTSIYGVVNADINNHDISEESFEILNDIFDYARYRELASLKVFNPFFDPEFFYGRAFLFDNQKRLRISLLTGYRGYSQGIDADSLRFMKNLIGTSIGWCFDVRCDGSGWHR